MPDTLQTVLDYHEASKHDFNAYADGPGHLDWANQPDPFRRYMGAELLPLERVAPTDDPPYEPTFVRGNLPVVPLNLHSVSRLFFDSLALSAWKVAGEARWALRVNPSSGNLHPTEGYLICGPVDGLSRNAMVAHYAPREHGLEVRAHLPADLWYELSAGFSEGTLFVGLTSIHWREAWKYGQRAYRYCQHDVGHALGAVSIAAGALGWRAELLDDLSTDQVSTLLGVRGVVGPEAEHADCLLAVYPHASTSTRSDVSECTVERFEALEWRGSSNVLSPAHVSWPWIDRVAEAARKPRTESPYGVHGSLFPGAAVGESPVALRRIVHQRRSAVAMDGRTGITAPAFYQMLLKLLPAAGQLPFDLLPWDPQVDLALFVHRVQGVEPGLYILFRDPRRLDSTRAVFRDDAEWVRPHGCPDALPLYRLMEADARNAAERLSCGQEIAADGCFSLGMIARFDEPLARFGPWFYPRLYWECGMIGQMLYLEAEACGIRATGIGCFFDEPVHGVLGFSDRSYQSLYHFTVGGAVDDPRLTTLPAYP